MALIPATLVAEIRKFTDDSFGSFTGFPADDAAAAAAWADALDAYVAGTSSFLVPPTTAAPSAKTILAGGLVGISAPGAAIALFDTAFAAYALALAGGMGPANVGIPPPAPLSVTPPTMLSVFAAGVAPPGASASVQAGAMAALIDTWMRTGTFTPASGGAAAPWS